MSKANTTQNSNITGKPISTSSIKNIQKYLAQSNNELETKSNDSALNKKVEKIVSTPQLSSPPQQINLPSKPPANSIKSRPSTPRLNSYSESSFNKNSTRTSNVGSPPPQNGVPPPYGPPPPCYTVKNGPPPYQGPCCPPPRPCAPVILCPVPPPPPFFPCPPPGPPPPPTYPVPMNSQNVPPPSDDSAVDDYFHPLGYDDLKYNQIPPPNETPCPSSTCITDFVTDTITLDVAFLSQEYSPIEVTCNNNHIIELDEICIDQNTFKCIFYPYGENFGLEKNNCCNPAIFPYITFLPPYRSINCGQPFSLLEQIIMNIENDLNVTRNCFTTCTLIELSKELSNIKTLCDIECCSLLCSLPWSNVQSIIKNDYINRVQNNPLRQMVLVISIIFKTPNTCILPTIIKFKYRMNIDPQFVL